MGATDVITSIRKLSEVVLETCGLLPLCTEHAEPPHRLLVQLEKKNGTACVGVQSRRRHTVAPLTPLKEGKAPQAFHKPTRNLPICPQVTPCAAVFSAASRSASLMAAPYQ